MSLIPPLSGEKRTSGGRAKMALMTDLVDDLGIRSCPAA
jgi:hypothetical protein